MKNKYEIRGDVTVIFMKKKDGTIAETIIDTTELTKVQAYKGTLSLSLMAMGAIHIRMGTMVRGMMEKISLFFFTDLLLMHRTVQ